MNDKQPIDRAARAAKYIVLHLVFFALWWLTYTHLKTFSALLTNSLLTNSLLHVAQTQTSRLEETLKFFFYDTPKVFMLLGLVVYIVGLLRSFITPEKTRKFLVGKSEFVGNILAALLGIVTPFCSCSALPLFIGFVSAGIPLGVTLSFLIAAPMINEVALILLYGLLGWKVAAIYLVTGLSIAIVAGIIIGRLRPERYLEDWVKEIRSTANSNSSVPSALSASSTASPASPPQTAAHASSQTATQTAPQKAATTITATTITANWGDRIKLAYDSVTDIFQRIWVYVLIGIALGAIIHGYVPESFMALIMSGHSWWSVPLAVLLGIPLYSNAAGVIPIVEALIGKGAAIGTVLAFMMSVIALSLPEMLILRKVLKLQLIYIFLVVVTLGIIIVGYLFNWII